MDEVTYVDPIFNIPSSFHPPTADQTVGPRAILFFYCMSISRISFRTALDGKYARDAHYQVMCERI